VLLQVMFFEGDNFFVTSMKLSIETGIRSKVIFDKIVSCTSLFFLFHYRLYPCRLLFSQSFVQPWCAFAPQLHVNTEKFLN
jgi:hypothetical protein